MDTRIYTLSPEEVCSLLGSCADGLSSEEAARRLSEAGLNEIEERAAVPIWRRLLANFTHLLAIMLWIAGVLAFISGTPQLGIAIFAVIFINAAFSFWQEYRAEQAIAGLREMLPKRSRVIRDGQEKEIEAKELVPGDIMVLGEGDSISADARLIRVWEMTVDNSALTGEAEPQIRRSEGLLEEWEDLTSRINLVFAGTTVAAGSGLAVAYATGMGTEFGKIAGLTQSVREEPSPLQKQLAGVSRVISAIAVILGITFFALAAFVIRMDRTASFLFAVGIIVANVPEGLLPTVTLTLAMGTRRMARRNALIKKLSSVETLGSTTVICTDKTGTLTTNQMTVTEVWVDGRAFQVGGVGFEPLGDFTARGERPGDDDLISLEALLRTACLCNNARLVEGERASDWSIIGDPTEGALLVAARKFGLDLDSELRAHPRVYELHFDSRRKRMTTINRENDRVAAHVKGAPKEVLEACTRIWGPSGARDLTEEDREAVSRANDGYASGALRVLGFATRDLGSERRHYEVGEVEKDLTFIGLVGMMDPPRAEVSSALEKCRTAGIRVIMITGDYGLTAESVARRIGLVEGPDVKVIAGSDIDEMDNEDLKKALGEPEVIFARVAPEHKMRVAVALKERGEVVAMTGDGVNDAPALKAADIGIAMGVTGTDVAKEAADMILTDDNFASIVSAVEEGRAAYGNIRAFLTYILTHNIAEAVPFLLFVIFRIPLPITVMQILAIDLGSDMLPALALGAERPEPGTMERRPRSQKERLLNRGTLARTYGFLGPIEALGAMAAYFFVYLVNGWHPSQGISAMADSGPVYTAATTACFAAIVMIQIANGLGCRSSSESVFRLGFTSNRLYLWGIAWALSIVVALMYLPGLSALFKTGPVGAHTWLFMFAWLPVMFFAEEGRKAIARRLRT